MKKRPLSERAICNKFFTPALENSGCDKWLQSLVKISFADGKICGRENITAVGSRKRIE